MSHPVLWPKSFFYPVGNSSAVCLTDNIPPEKSATVLSLGCGDPRNILYTLHADPPIHRPAIDFVCCDIEPAIIARNVLLLTLIYDNHPTNRVWDIFYHMKLDKTSFALFISHSKALYNISGDLQSWQQSRYSRFLKFCSTYTLSQVHHYLGLYAQTEAYSREKHDQLFTCFTREFEAHYRPEFIPDTASSAGPFSMEFVQTLSKHFHHYWKTGTVFRSTAGVTYVNPSFIYSDSSTPSLVGDRCSLHYGTYPLQGFHLAAAALSGDKITDESITEAQLVSCAQSQLEQWCYMFRATVAQQSVAIRLLTADALAFCQKITHLRSRSESRLHVSPWKTAELALDGDFDVSAAFDTIDTSNLADHVGVLNVLIAAVPLLPHSPTSVLYTEFVVDKAESTKASNLTTLLCADIPTISVLLGVSPVGCVAQFTSSTRVHQTLGTSSYRERFAWKCPYPIVDEDSITPSFPDPVALGNLLFSIYKQMFADEDLKALLSRLLRASDVVHYHRGTFAALLGLIKSRVQTDWVAAMEHIFHLLHNDRTLIMGSNNYQELCCQLYLRGVYCVEALGPHRALLTPIDRSSGLFKGWKEVPPVVSVVLVVPRHRIRMLEGQLGRQLGSPMFQCELRGTTFSNIFSSIRVVLGTVSVRGSGCDAQVNVVEDPKGWSGTAPLIVSVCLPAFNLVLDGEKSTRISFGVHSTPAAAVLLGNTLGPALNLYTANVWDASAVYITINTPDYTQSSSTVTPPSPRASLVSVTINGSRVSTMSARWEPGISLKDAKVDHMQISHCVMQVEANGVKKNLVYPFPIDSTQTKIRIARKSGWIEFEAPVRPSRASTDLVFASAVAHSRCPIAWNIHRINLESLPLLESESIRRQTSTIAFNCFLALSDREHAFREPNDMLVQVKKTIMQLIVQTVNSRGKRPLVLSNPGKGGVHTLLYINGICMDLASHTYVLDACVLTLAENLVRGPLESQIFDILFKAEHIPTSTAEVRSWKHLLVAFSERYRSWTHKTTCEYAAAGKIPVSTDMLQNPLCGCGEGIGLGRLSRDSSWIALAPFMTRVAISPLFAPQYLESIDQRIEKCCVACGKAELLNEATLSKCGRCKAVEYCGKGCQLAHWKEHKRVCKAK
ncbi:hypothetical protein B0H14DRAFT_2435899 [Mycena olivaceomarginata]|nr:hypothetical protein B0H14DRAFT_2435899 [Mycena olivaceomarginata]